MSSRHLLLASGLVGLCLVSGCTPGTGGSGNTAAGTSRWDDVQPKATPSMALTTNASSMSTRDITAAQAHQVVFAAMAKAAEIGTKMDIAVVDAGGNLKAFVRMDGAWLGSIDIAQRKARTARYFDMPTGDIGKLSQPGGPLYNIEHSNGGLITFPGGIPLKAADGTIIGAIGVSGSSVDKDHAVAEAGVKALTDAVKQDSGRM